jgi:AraC-like DNA-binding protein
MSNGSWGEPPEGAFAGDGRRELVICVPPGPVRERIVKAAQHIAATLSPVTQLDQLKVPSVPRVVIIGAAPGVLQWVRAAVRRLRTVDGTSIVLLCLQPGSAWAAELPKFARAGVDDVLFVQGTSEYSPLGQEIERWLGHALPPDAFSPPQLGSGGLGLMIIGHCVRRGYERLAASDLGRHFGCSRRSVLRAVRGTPWPTIRFLDAFARLAHVKHALKETSDTVEKLAVKLGFASASGLSRFVQRTTGQTVREFRSGLN